MSAVAMIAPVPRSITDNASAFCEVTNARSPAKTGDPVSSSAKNAPRTYSTRPKRSAKASSPA